MATDEQKRSPVYTPPPGFKVVAVELSALTRVYWSGEVLVPASAETDNSNLRDLVDAVYDEIDGGEYDDDPDYWERGQSCDAYPADPALAPPSLVAAVDELGYFQPELLERVPSGEDPAEVLRRLKARRRPEDLQ